MTRLPALLALVGLSACLPASPLTEVLPDERIKVNLPLATAAKDGTRDWATWYLATAEVTENVNGLIGYVLVLVDTITTWYPPSYVNEDRTSATWGPWADALDPVETVLHVTHDVETDMYTWGFDQWPKDLTDEDARTVVAGEVDPGATREASTGRFVVDFTTIHELDPTEEGTGTFTVEYDIRTDGASAWATFEDFGPEGLQATYFYDQAEDGSGTMDLVLTVDLNPGTGTGTEETLYVRSRWTAEGAGRSDVIGTGGDLGTADATLSECWSTSFERVYYTDDYSGAEEGDAAACVFPDASFLEPEAAE